MNRFHFRLESVLRLREVEETKRQRELGVAMRNKQQAEERYQTAVDAIAAHDHETEESAQGLVSAAGLDAHHRYMQSLERQREMGEREIEKAGEVVDARRAELVEAARKKKTLERLRERALEAHEKEALLEEQRTLDDLTSIKYRSGEQTE